LWLLLGWDGSSSLTSRGPGWMSSFSELAKYIFSSLQIQSIQIKSTQTSQIKLILSISRVKSIQSLSPVKPIKSSQVKPIKIIVNSRRTNLKYVNSSQHNQNQSVQVKPTKISHFKSNQSNLVNSGLKSQI
jgi:hypothetical protein